MIIIFEEPIGNITKTKGFAKIEESKVSGLPHVFFLFKKLRLKYPRKAVFTRPNSAVSKIAKKDLAKMVVAPGFFKLEK